MVDKKLLIIFSLWACLAIFLIMLGLVISTFDIAKDKNVIYYVITLSSALFQSTGSAILVASVFSCVLTTESFFDYTTKRLREIVVSNDYLNKLDMSEKQKLMGAIINPGKKLSSIYSGIPKYYDQHIKKSMKMNAELYRSNFILDCVVKFDAEKKILLITDFHGKERAPNFFNIDSCFDVAILRSTITPK